MDGWMDGWTDTGIDYSEIDPPGKKKKLEKESFKVVLNTVTELQGDRDCKMTTELKEFTFGEVLVQAFLNISQNIRNEGQNG